MNINSITKGVIVNILLNILTVTFLTMYKFDLRFETLTIILLINLLIVTFFIGSRSKKHMAELGGFIIGLFSAISLLLFISYHTELKMEINGILVSLWSAFGFAGSFLGRISFSKKKNKKLFT